MTDVPPQRMIDEWNLLQAAKWVGVAPWELERAGTWWVNRILSVISVETGLAKAHKEKV